MPAGQQKRDHILEKVSRSQLLGKDKLRLSARSSHVIEHVILGLNEQVKLCLPSRFIRTSHNSDLKYLNTLRGF